MNTQPSIITMGGYGWNFLHTTQEFLNASILCVDSLDDEGRERRVRLPDIAFDGCFSENDKKQIKDFVKDLEFVYVLAGLAGSNGEMIAPLLEVLRESEVFPITILTMPYQSEGVKKNDLARERFEKIKSKRGLHIVFSNELLLEHIKNLSVGIRAMYAMHDNAVIDTIKRFEIRQQPINLWDLLGFYDEAMKQTPHLIEKIHFSF